MRAIEEKAREEGRAFDDRQRKLHQEMHALLDTEKPDVDAVMQLAANIGQAQADALKHHLKAMLAIRALLTPQQLKELVLIHEEEGRKWRHDD
jgi:Spy/CpxP family protein refolding chaperone